MLLTRSRARRTADLAGTCAVEVADARACPSVRRWLPTAAPLLPPAVLPLPPVVLLVPLPAV